MKFSGTISLQYDTPFSPFSVSEYEEGLDWLKAEGFDGAELCISHYRDLDLEQIQKKLTERGLECSTISTGQSRTLEGFSLLHEGEALKRCQERLRQHIDAAAFLKCRVTIGLLRGVGSPDSQQEDTLRLAKNLEPIVDYALQKKVTLLLESLNRYETSLCTGVQSTMDFIRNDLGNPGCVKILWDLFHANIEDPKLLEAIDAMGSKLGHVHLADSNRWFPGYGHIDLTSIAAKLKRTGFDGYLSFECLNLPNRETVRISSGSLIQRLRSI